MELWNLLRNVFHLRGFVVFLILSFELRFKILYLIKLKPVVDMEGILAEPFGHIDHIFSRRVGGV